MFKFSIKILKVSTNVDPREGGIYGFNPGLASQETCIAQIGVEQTRGMGTEGGEWGIWHVILKVQWK